MRLAPRAIAGCAAATLALGAAMVWGIGWLLSRPVPVRIGPAPADLFAEDVTFRSESGSVIVVLHGGPGSNMNAVWLDLEPIAKGRSVLLYDQRGSGRSPVITDPAQLTATHHVRDLEALREHFGMRRMTIVGESWGSGLAILYTAAHPDRVEKLVLVGPIPPTRAVTERRLDESDAAMNMRAKLAEIRRVMPTVSDPIATCREFFRIYTRQFFANPDNMNKRRGSSCDAPAEGVRNYFVVNEATLASLGDYDLRPSLSKFRLPVLVVEGEKSIPSTVASARDRRSGPERHIAAHSTRRPLPAG